jgi:exodeoxyribonuclease VII large subunit
MKRPDEYTNILSMNLDNLTNRFFTFSKLYLDKVTYKLQTSIHKLNAMNPFSVLSRGYSITTDDRGNVIKNASNLRNSDVILTTLHNGKIRSVVEKAVQDE